MFSFSSVSRCVPPCAVKTCAVRPVFAGWLASCGQQESKAKGGGRGDFYLELEGGRLSEEGRRGGAHRGWEGVAERKGSQTEIYPVQNWSQEMP